MGTLGLLAVLVAFPRIDRPGESPVADAAMRGDSAAVRALLRSGADVNAAQGDGMTALHWAARRGDGAMTAMLLYAGADHEVTTRLGAYTPLHLAARAGRVTAARVLLEHGANPTARTTTGGATPLHLAAEAGNAEVVRRLIDAGADPDVRDEAWDETPLMYAAAADRVDVVRTLLAMGADVAVTARTVNIPALEARRRAERRRRDDRLAALRALSVEVGGEQPPAPQAEAGPRRGEPGYGGVAAPARAAGEPSRERSDRERALTYGELVGGYGGFAALHFAARQGNTDVALALIEAGADLNQVTAGDHTSPMLIALINGHYDLALELLARGADPNLASDAGTTPLFAALNVQWAPKARYPQQHAYAQQRASYLEVMQALLDAGADPNARLTKHLWYLSYNFDLLRVNTTGATPFWRAAYATDVAAMTLLMSYGADPTIPTIKVPSRQFGRGANGSGKEDPSGLPPVPIGGPGVYPIHAAAGVGYGEGYAANAHRHVPGGWLPAMQYLVEEIGADVNARDLNGYTPLHHAAARGDTTLIRYLVEHGADVTAVSRRGQTTADMANGPVQRVQPFPDAVALLERLGSKNNHHCVSC